MKCVHHANGTFDLQGLTVERIAIIRGGLNLLADREFESHPRIPELTTFFEEIWDYTYAAYEANNHVELGEKEPDYDCTAFLSSESFTARHDLSALKIFNKETNQ